MKNIFRDFCKVFLLPYGNYVSCRIQSDCLNLAVYFPVLLCLFAEIYIVLFVRLFSAVKTGVFLLPYFGNCPPRGQGDYMIQIKNVSFTHRKDLKEFLKDFSLTLNYGDKAVIIGEEGNGKSTLLKWIYNPELISDYVEFKGERLINNEVLAYLPQELLQEDKEKSLYEFFLEEDEFLNLTPKELGKLSANFNLNTDFYYSEQKLKTLSGGEKIKAQIMRILMKKPTVLLLDEPSNDIDISTLKWLENFINSWEYIVLFISHDETLIENTANTVVHMEQLRRKTVSRCEVHNIPYREYISQRTHLFEIQEQQAVYEKKQKEIRNEKFRKIYQKVLIQQHKPNRGYLRTEGFKRNREDRLMAFKSREYRFEREDENMTQMPESEEAINIKQNPEQASIPSGKYVIEYTLDKLTTPDHRVLAENIELNIRGSKKICIIGNNGCGKTTLIKQIAENLLARKDIKAMYMPQNYEEELDLSMTPVDYLDKTGDKTERTKIKTFLGSLKYTAEEMSHAISELSGGQKAKILLLKMILSDANVLILDEPTRNFSPLSAPVIRNMLANFSGSIISISHDRKYIDEVCDTVYELSHNGLFKQE